MITFYQVFSILIMAFLVLAIVTTITTEPISILFTIPFWPIAVFMFRLGKKAATLEEWLVITENEIVLRKKNFSYLKESRIAINEMIDVSMKTVGWWTSIKNMSYYVKRRQGEYEHVLYPTITYKHSGTKTVTFFENATDMEMVWITTELQKLVTIEKT